MGSAARLVLLAAAAGTACVALAQDDHEEAPDLGFLEYLGSWQGSDEDWLVVADIEDTNLEDRDPAPDGDAGKDEDSDDDEDREAEDSDEE
jgi:hypothetical protein